MTFTEMWQEHKVQVVLIGIGVGLMLLGVKQMLDATQGSEVVLEQESETTVTAQELVIDVGGAVMKPGVYRVPAGSRIVEGLAQAGGMSEEADREWVDKHINMAEPVKDGMKLYVPKVGSGDVSGQVSESGEASVNVNTASMAELVKLNGIGEVRAQAIITNRPYLSWEDFVKKTDIPQSVIDKNKELLSLY